MHTNLVKLLFSGDLERITTVCSPAMSMRSVSSLRILLPSGLM